jgi:hypothetical protein
MPRTYLRPRLCAASAAVSVLLASSGCASDADGGSLFGSASASASAGTDGSSGGGPTGSGGSGLSGATGATSTGATTAGSASTTGASGGTDGGILYDVGGGETGGTATGCKKIDFLFVVDNSSSMFNHQEALTASFPGFIEAIVDVVGTSDFHIMVVDTDAKADPNDGCGECYERCVQGVAKNCGFPDPDDSGAPGICNGAACSDIAPQTPDACDYVLGAGVTDDRWEQSCAIQGTGRYIQGGQPDLTETFECIARTGVYGTGKELVMGAMVEAVGMNGPSQCNEGFVRDDAILVVTLLSDAVYEPGAGMWGTPVGTPQSWYDALVAAKKGNAEAIVTLGLLNAPSIPGGACDWPPASSDMYLEFLQMFGARGFANTVCTGDYAAFFASSLQTIDTTCDDFQPEG